MWKDLFDLVRQALRLSEDTQQTRADLKELQKEVRDLARKSEREMLELRYEQARRAQALEAQLERQNDEIRRLREELQQSHEREEMARRLVLTEIENRLLKASRQLPPPELKPKQKNDEES